MQNIREIAKVYRKISINNQPTDFAYWQSKSYQERLACLEQIRQEYHGRKNNTEQDFREFIQSLNGNGVRYLVIGGYAVAFHGHPRYTRDIDIWLELTEENAVRTVKALFDFGFGSLGLKDEDFLVPDQIIQLGYPPNRIDLLTSLENMNFEECYNSRIEVDIDGVRVKFIDLPNLRKCKKIAGRLQDLADLENLK